MRLSTIGICVSVAALSITADAQTKGKTPVEGVWRVAEIQVTGGQNPGTVSNPQPGLYIFTSGYYSVMTVNSDKPRPDLNQPQGATITDAQKIALYEHWAPFTANSGTYTIKGSTITTRPLVAKNQGVMQGDPQTREFKVEGTTLWLITKQGAAENRTRLTRVE